MAQIRLQPPDPFNFRNPDDWPRWKRRFQQFREASGLSEAAALKQTSTFLYCLGEEAEAVLSSTNATAEERADYDSVLAKFDSFFRVRKNVIYERARFNRRDQQSGETAEQYIMALYDLAEHCDYGALKEELIRDRLVVGIRDTALSQRLQMDSALTLESAKKSIRQKEAVHEQQQALKGGDKATNASSLDAIRPKRQTNPRIRGHRSERRDHPRDTQTGTKQPPRNPQTGGKCSRCGRERHPREKCPARDAQCPGPLLLSSLPQRKRSQSPSLCSRPPQNQPTRASGNHRLAPGSQNRLHSGPNPSREHTEEIPKRLPRPGNSGRRVPHPTSPRRQTTCPLYSTTRSLTSPPQSFRRTGKNGEGRSDFQSVRAHPVVCWDGSRPQEVRKCTNLR